MALNSSGTISLGGTTAGQSVELEYGGSGSSAISMNDSNVRQLYVSSSGSTISLANLHGKGGIVSGSRGSGVNYFWGWTSIYGSPLSKFPNGATIGSLKTSPYPTSSNGTTVYGVYCHSTDSAGSNVDNYYIALPYNTTSGISGLYVGGNSIGSVSSYTNYTGLSGALSSCTLALISNINQWFTPVGSTVLIDVV